MRAPSETKTSRQVVSARWRGMCGRCGGPGREYSHRRPRGIRDAHAAHPCNAVWLCRTCHAWCHKNPADARALGLHLSRYVEDPSAIPVKLVVGWVLLGCDGEVEFIDPPPEMQ